MSEQQPVAGGETLYIDLIAFPGLMHPGDAARSIGLGWTGWEAQPLGDRIKLTGCTGAPDPLPKWLYRQP